jgi:hypothetical protein
MEEKSAEFVQILWSGTLGAPSLPSAAVTFWI